MQEFYDRLSAWAEETHKKLRRHWFLWPVALFFPLTEHRILEAINHYLDSHTGAAVRGLKGLVMHIPSDPLIVAVLLSLAILVSLAVHAYFDVRKGKPPEVAGDWELSLPEPVQTASAVESVDVVINPPVPIVRPEAMEQISGLYFHWKKLWTYIDEYLVADFWLNSPASGDKAIVAMLLQSYVLPQFQAVRSEFHVKIMTVSKSSESEFRDFLRVFMEMLTVQYPAMIRVVLACGDSWLGSGFTSSEGYQGLYQRHLDAVEALRRLRGRSDLGELTGALRALENLLQRPETSRA